MNKEIRTSAGIAIILILVAVIGAGTLWFWGNIYKKESPTAWPGWHKIEGPKEGVLRGKISISPTCPVEMPGKKTCSVISPDYTSQEIIVYSSDGKIVAARTNPDADGNYYLKLPAGTYLVAIKQSGIAFSKDVPRQVKIEAGETAVLDINIDTGIR